jgi:hypothetical protein
MERSPHLSLRIAAENLEPSASYGVNTFVDQFAVAMKRSTSPNTGSRTGRLPIETAPRDGGFLILEEDANGKYDIARWAPEAGGWVRENGEPVKIAPSYWYPIEGESYLQQGLDVSTSPSQPGLSSLGRAAPQGRFAWDIIASCMDAASPETVAAVKTESTAVEPKRASRARNRFAAFSIAASLVGAVCIGMYFRAEVTAYMARDTVRQDLFWISTIGGQVVGQAGRWLSRNLESQVFTAQMSQGQDTQVDASTRHIVALQPQTEPDSVGTQATETTPAEPATLLEPAAITVEHSHAPAGERDRGATLASELAMARRDFEAKAALLSKAADEATQLRQTAEATATGLRQSLLQERDRVAAQARELATVRRNLEAEVALSSKAGEEAEQLRQAAKAASAELEQERNRSAALARDLESAQRVIGAHSTTERPAGSQIDPMKQVAEQAVAESSRTAAQGNPEAARLMARASALLAQGSIGAARIVLERAVETGSAAASFALAETYDPLVLSKWGTYGTRGEATKARELYSKAQAGGIQEANDRINALRQ